MSSSDSAWYALRRTLPPWSFEDNLDELVRVLPRYRVDEVIVKVDTEEFSHGQPILAWVADYQQKLYRIRERMTELGIVYSLNPWITVGHNDRGRDSRERLPGLRTMVGHDGTRCAVCACPLDPVWRTNTADVWRLYAETHPRVIWVEDDVRTFNHRPVRYSCFCEEHLRRFGERVGRPVSREDLVEAVLAAGPPHPWRAEWLRLQDQGILDTMRFLAKTVHAVSPETCLGLMSSGPRMHCLEGRDWDALSAALADGRDLYSRPPMGNYSENSLRGFYYCHDSIKLTRHCLPGAVEQTEVENVPFTRYSKSDTFTWLEMALSFAYGSDGVTLNLYDHCGTPLEAEPTTGRMLADRKPVLNALAEKARRPGRYRGVQILHHPHSAFTKRLSGDAAYMALREEGGELQQMLESHGIATTYEDEGVVATSGQVLHAFEDDAVRGLLRGGLVLDATAACVLAERGFGNQIGVKSIRPPVPLDSLGAFSAEEFHNPRFGGAAKRFLTLTVPDLAGRPDVSVVELADEAEPVSHLVDPDAARHHVGMFAYENELGGRVVVHCLDLESAFGGAFCHPFRSLQLQGVVRWLSREAPPLLVEGGAFPLAFRKDCERSTLLGLFNLTLDDWPAATFHLATDRAALDGVEKLTSEGCWEHTETLQWDGQTAHWPHAISHDQPLFLFLQWR